MQLETSIPNKLYSGPQALPAPHAISASAQQIDFVPVSGAEVYSCTRGVVAGFILESAMALAIFGVWQLWHLVR